MFSQFFPLTPLALGTLAIGACFFGDDDQPGNPVPNPSTTIFEIPATLVSSDGAPSQAKVTSTKESDISVFQVYEPVPAIITTAENARHTVSEILNELYDQDLPRKLESQQDGISLSVARLDSADTKWSEIKWMNTTTGDALHLVTKSSNASVGHVTWENQDQALIVRLDFTDENKTLDGRKLRVEYRNTQEDLNSPTDPRLIVINATQKEDKVHLSGKSFSPEFKDLDSLWYQGKTVPSIYAWRAVADESQSQAILQVAFGPSAQDGERFQEDYAIDQFLLQQLLENLIGQIEEDQNVLKAFYWSIENMTPVEPGSNPKLTLYETTKTPSDITLEELEQFAEIQLSTETPHPDYQALSLLSKAKQPIFLSLGAQIDGNTQTLDKTEMKVNISELESTPDYEPINY